MFRLETFGGLVVVDEAGVTVATQHRRLALLALLAVAGARGLSRAKLQAFLWSEGSAESARHGLEQLVYYLRRQIGPDLFLGPDPLRLNPLVITTDVGQFEQLLASETLDQAAGLYRGPFLDGFYLSRSPEFERWVEEERSRLAAACREALLRLAEGEEAVARPEAAIGWWRKLVMVDQLNTRATLGLMRAMAATGDRTGALRLAREHNELVQQELAAPPSPEVGELVARICESQPAGSPARNAGPKDALADDRLPTPQRGELGQVESGDSAIVRSLSPKAEAPRSRRLLTLGAGAGTLATLAAIAVLGSRPMPTSTLDPNLVAVAPFEVLDPRLELWREGLIDVLSANLDGAGPLRAVPPTLVVRRWRGRVDRASTADLARRTGARLAVFGRLALIGGDSVRLRAALLDASRSDILAELEFRAAEANLDRLTDSLTVALLRELGRTRRIGVVRTASLGSTSLPALKAYLQGEQLYRRWASDSALALYERAVALDSTFAMATARASQLLWSRNDSLARVLSLRAGALNRGLPPRESLLITADSLLTSTGFGAVFDSAASARRVRVLAILDTAARRYPEDPEIWYQLGDARVHLGWDSADSLRELLAAFDRAIALDSSFGVPYAHAVQLSGWLADWAGARRRAAAMLRHVRPGSTLGESSAEVAAGVELTTRLLDSRASGFEPVERLLRTAPAFSLWFAWDVLQLLADSAEVAVQLARTVVVSRSDEDSSAGGLHGHLFQNKHRLLAASLAYRGHLSEAGRVLGSANSPFLPSLFAELALEGGVPYDSARVIFDRWLRQDPFWPAHGLVFALPWWSGAGDTASIQRFRRRAVAASGSLPVSASGRRNLDDPRYGAEAARAYLTLARHDSADALRRFAALPLTSCPSCFLERLTYARLLAAQRRDREALAALNPGFPMIYSFPTRGVWELERARIAERLDQKANAAQGYGRVVQLWPHADPPLQSYVAEARAALDRLPQAARR